MFWFWLASAVIVLFGLIVFRGAPYVPSQKRYVRQALSKLYPLGPKDTLVDVGSGDGIVLRLASDRGARAIGYELNPLLVVISWWLSRRNKLVTTHLADFWPTPLPDGTTVVYVFAATPYLKRMVNKLQRETDRLGRPLAVIVHGNSFVGRHPDVMLGAYNLYTFHPLQGREAQV